MEAITPEASKNETSPSPETSAAPIVPAAQSIVPAQPAKPVLPFGVGCFYFRFKKKPPIKFTVLEYIQAVEAFLQGISNISNITINKDNVEDKDTVVENKEGDTEPNYKEVFFVEFLEIRFEVYIPKRVQQQITSRSKTLSARTINCERFRVSILDEYHCPVTFIEIIDVHPDDDPSDAVVIVREFLRSQQQHSTSDLIYFDVLGPSPFHANFSINPNKTENQETPWLFWEEIFETGSYDDIEFFYDTDALQTIEKARDLIFHEIKQELGLYYGIKSEETVRRSAYVKAKSVLDNIITIQKQKGLIGSIRRYFLSTQLRDVFVAIAEFESNDLILNQSIQDSYRITYESRDKHTSLQRYVDKALKSRTEYPTRQLIDLANLFESRREKLIESVIVLISAILGGIFGSIITLLLSQPPTP